MNVGCLDFLKKKKFDESFFILYGNEPVCIYKSKEHIIQSHFSNLEFKRINLDLEDKDFFEILNETTMSQDMFASGKIIFFNFSKNRFNKEIRERIQLISNHDANILSVLEITDVKQSTLKKDVLSKLSKGMFVDCSEPSEKEIFECFEHFRLVIYKTILKSMFDVPENWEGTDEKFSRLVRKKTQRNI